MDSPTPSSADSAVLTIPAASTDELLHALSATVISQHSVITMMSGLVMQLYCTVNHLPPEAGDALFEKLMPDSIASANAGFSGSLQERRQGLQDLLHQ